MTSTPNSSFIPMENYNGKTAHNTIGRRKSKTQSKRTPLPLLVRFILSFKYTIKSLFLGDSRYRRRHVGVLVICVNYFCIFFFTLCLSVRIY
jgi:hypothetical protein